MTLQVTTQRVATKYFEFEFDLQGTRESTKVGLVQTRVMA